MLIIFLFSQVDSLSLNEAIERILIASPTYYESKITLEKSRIFFYQTLANLLPTLSASGQYTKTDFQGVESSGYSGSLNLTQPLFDLDIFSSILVARRQLKGSTMQHESNIAALILRLKTAYYGLINARELLRSSDIAIQRAEENLKLITAKFELGAASRLEMLQGEVFQLRTLEDRARARSLHVTAQEELKCVLGSSREIFPTDTLLAPDSITLPSLDSLVAILEKVNYAILLARELRNVASLDLLASYFAFLPRISFFYGYTYSAESLIFNFQHFEDNSSKNYGITVAFPIFEIKSLIFRHLNAKKELQKQKYAQQRVLFETEKSLRTSYYALNEAHERLRFAERSLAAADEAAMIAREQYALGIISFLDFLTAEKDMYEARVSYTSALSDLYTQRANLSYFLGNSIIEKE